MNIIINKKVNVNSSYFSIIIMFMVILFISVIVVVNIKISNSKTTYFYDFEDDPVDSFPVGFVGVGRSTTTTFVVQWNFDDGHKGHVVKIQYPEKNDYGGIELNTLFNKKIIGTVSFDVYLSTFKSICIDLCQEDVIFDSRDDICIRVPLTSSYYFTVKNGMGLLQNITSTSELEHWYHITIHFNCQENQWNIIIYDQYLNKQLCNYSFRFSVQPEYFCQLYFATYVIDNAFYIDNVSIS